MENLETSVISKLVAELAAKQEELIKGKIVEKLGFMPDMIAESKRIFPRLAIVKQENEQTYYWNDGNDPPLRIITFVDTGIDFSGMENGMLKTGKSWY